MQRPEDRGDETWLEDACIVQMRDEQVERGEGLEAHL
jgi:hypothetical protein